MTLPLLDYWKNFSMKSHVFKKNPWWENNQLNQYKNWLELKNFSSETIEKYLRTVTNYGQRDLNTLSIVDLLRGNLEKY